MAVVFQVGCWDLQIRIPWELDGHAHSTWSQNLTLGWGPGSDFSPHYRCLWCQSCWRTPALGQCLEMRGTGFHVIFATGCENLETHFALGALFTFSVKLEGWG